MKHIAMYEVQFIHYSDSDYTRVSSYRLNEYGTYVDEDGKSISFGGNNYEMINIPNPFIIREDEIEKYRKYGCGFRSLKYLGSIIEETD